MIKHFVVDVDAYIYMLDSSLLKVREEANSDYWKFLRNIPDFDKTKPLMVLGGKSDLKESCTTQEIEALLELNQLPATEQEKTKVFLISTKNNDGLTDAFSWLISMLEK